MTNAHTPNLFLAGIGALATLLAVSGALLLDARRRIDALERAQTSPPGQRPPASPLNNGSAEEANARSMADLRARVVALESSVGLVQPREPVATRDDVPPHAAAELPTGQPEGLVPTATTDDGRTSIQELIRDELQQAERARDDRRAERWRARTQEKLDALAQDGHLNQEQRQKLTMMIDAEQQEIRQLFRDARDNGDFSSVRDQVRALRAQTDENALAILHENQEKAYLDMREEGRRLFGADGSSPPRP